MNDLDINRAFGLGRDVLACRWVDDTDRAVERLNELWDLGPGALFGALWLWATAAAGVLDDKKLGPGWCIDVHGRDGRRIDNPDADPALDAPLFAMRMVAFAANGDVNGGAALLYGRIGAALEGRLPHEAVWDGCTALADLAVGMLKKKQAEVAAARDGGGA